MFAMLYFYKDPFKVLYYYENYYNNNQINPIYLNKDHVSTQNLINKTNKYGLKHNSFIIGNSKTVFLDAKKWSEKINESENSCYHFDASAETLIGIKNKMLFLDKNNYRLKNVIISLDYSTLRKDYLGDRQLNINSYLNTEGISRIYFHYIHLKTFFNSKFFFPYLIYMSNGERLSKFMYKLRIFDEKKIKYNSVTNEIRYPEIDSLINCGLYHSSNKLSELPDNREGYFEPIISESQLNLLNEIRSILDKQNSSYKIIIPPSYDKMKLASDDIRILDNILGEENIYDFSGENTITKNKLLYYEQTHFLPKVWDMLLDSIYDTSKSLAPVKVKLSLQKQ